MKNILLLDDDPVIHQLVGKVVVSLSYGFFPCLTAAEAEEILGKEKIDFVICDLFLEGDFGDKLSNDFIRNIVVPRQLPFCRFTSAPSQVPEDCIGLALIDKREVYADDTKLYQVLTSLV